MPLSRRGFLKASALAAGAAAVGIPNPAAAANIRPARPAGTTLERTLTIASRAGRVGGYAPVILGPAEPTVLRADLGGAPQPGREGRRRTLVAFAQLSDVHVVDSESPARVEWLDRYNDGPINDPVNGAYRPQETLTTQVADAMVRQINNIGVGPVTGAALAFAIQTGDNADNTQLNEVRWNIDLLDGGRIIPASGDPAYAGVMDQDAIYYDPHYWHPDGTPALRTDDYPRSRYGFPVVANLLSASATPFQAQGLNIPWYTAHGNHDGLLQGNMPYSPVWDTVARGDLKLITVPPGLSPDDVMKAMSTDPKAFLGALVPSGYARVVTADQNRRTLTRRETIEQHFTTTGAPVGHGFQAANVANDNAYYVFDSGAVRFIVLDTVNPNGYADGSLNATQFAWLLGQLEDASLGNRYAVICSHHTSETMGNPLVASGTGSTDDSFEQRVLGPAVVAALHAQPKVLAWVNGHSHQNRVWARPRPGGSGGFWEINTAAHIDFPQQSRLIEIVDNRDGTLSILATMVDHAGPASYGGVISDKIALAGLSRELAANDWQARAGNDATDGSGKRGAPTDRNVELLLPRP